MTINLLLLILAIVLFCLYGFGVGTPDNAREFLGFGLAAFAAAHISWPRVTR